jgi:hypothetical protein
MRPLLLWWLLQAVLFAVLCYAIYGFSLEIRRILEERRR